jgi:chromosome segregation ATPase
MTKELATAPALLALRAEFETLRTDMRRLEKRLGELSTNHGQLTASHNEHDDRLDEHDEALREHAAILDRLTSSATSVGMMFERIEHLLKSMVSHLHVPDPDATPS